jgi:hypothetical protein
MTLTVIKKVKKDNNDKKLMKLDKNQSSSNNFK